MAEGAEFVFMILMIVESDYVREFPYTHRQRRFIPTPDALPHSTFYCRSLSVRLLVLYLRRQLHLWDYPKVKWQGRPNLLCPVARIAPAAENFVDWPVCAP